MSGPRRPPSPHPDDNAPEVDDLRAQLAAERDGTAYWREVARQRRVDAARVQQRPMVRAAVALDRRTRRQQQAAQAVVGRLTGLASRVTLRAEAVRVRAEMTGRRHHLSTLTVPADTAPAPPDPRTIVVVCLGPVPSGPHRQGVHVQSLTQDQVDGIVAASTADLVCLLGPWSVPLTADWLDQLAATIGGDTVAVVPQVVHGERRGAVATAHDLLVQSIGLLPATAPDGSPLVVANGAGERPDLHRDSQDVLGATGAGVLMVRQQWIDAGGIGHTTDGGSAGDAVDELDAAVLDLCLRVRRSGGRLRSAPAALISDDRPVAGHQQLVSPLERDGASWRALVDRHGSAVLAEQDRWDLPSVVITTATPSMKIAPRSGDWHYAQRLAVALRRAGHQTRVQTIDRVDATAGRAADVHLVLRGLEPVRRTEGQRHVLWVISHPEALDAAECDDADLVVVASTRFADHLRTLTDTPVEVLLQATDPDHFRPRPVDPRHRHPLTVVANTRGVDRRMVIDAVAAGLTPAVYGTGWEGGIGADLVVADYVDFDGLPTVYSSAGVVLNDHWDTMRRWGFVSNRIFDVAACGVPIISDHLPEIEGLFGDLVPMWGDPDELASLVAEVASDPEATAARAEAARDLVLQAHTFDHRVAELMGLLVDHGLIAPPGDR